MSNLGLPTSKRRRDRHANQQTGAWLTSQQNGSRSKSGTSRAAKKHTPKLSLPIVAAAAVAVALIMRPGAGSGTDPQETTTKEPVAVAEVVEEPTPTLADLEFHVTTSVLEYSDKDVDPVSLVEVEGIDGSSSKSDVEVEISTEDSIDLQVIGEQTVHYHVQLGDEQGDFDATYTVRDTKAPTVSLAQTTCTVTAGDSFDPLGNVTSVTDPVEGDLAHATEAPGMLEDNATGLAYEHGWYTLTGSYDTGTPGTYHLTVEAHDNHDNVTHKEFDLVVELATEPEPEPVAEPVAQPEPQTHTYILNTNTHKFHYPDCRSVRQMADHNKREFTGTRDEVVAMGYDACQNCNP